MSRITIPWKTYLHYKQHLNTMDTLLYQSILDGLLEWKSTITIPPYDDVDHVYNVFTMVLRDVPMLFHVSNALQLSLGAVCLIKPTYIMDETTYQVRFKQVESFLKNSKARLGKYGAFNRYQLIHDNIAKHVIYHDTDTHNEHNVLGTILDRKSVCESMAKTYKLLCDYLMIPAVVVFGYSNADNPSVAPRGFSVSSVVPEDNHAWNIVKLDGQWYNVDLTFDVVLSEYGTLGAFRYDYFLRSDKIFLREHHPSQHEYLPKCPQDFNLYSKLDLCARSTKDVKDIIKTSILRKPKTKIITFGVDKSAGLTETAIKDTASLCCLMQKRAIEYYTSNPAAEVFSICLR